MKVIAATLDTDRDGMLALDVIKKVNCIPLFPSLNSLSPSLSLSLSPRTFSLLLAINLSICLKIRHNFWNLDSPLRYFHCIPTPYKVVEIVAREGADLKPRDLDMLARLVERELAMEAEEMAAAQATNAGEKGNTEASAASKGAVAEGDRLPKA